MPRTRSDLVHREPQEAPGPPIALNRMASAEIAGLEPSWVDPDAPAPQLEALSEEGQLQEATQAPVVHHCATCTDPACVGPISAAPDVQAHDTNVGLHIHTARSKATTDRILQENTSSATLPDVAPPELASPDLFQLLSPEIRDMIFELVYADSYIVAATQGFCTCSPGNDDVDFHGQGRTESLVLLKGSRGKRCKEGCYLEPYDETEGVSDVASEVEWCGMSPISSLLLVNKQTYLETIPHLYRSATFFFDDWEDTEKFARTVGPHCLEHILTVAVFADDEPCCGDGLPYRLPDKGTEWKYTTLFRAIVTHMPNIEHLKIGFWQDSHISLESDTSNNGWAPTRRCDQFEKALLQFSALKHMRWVDVELLWVSSNHGVDGWDHEDDNLVTQRGVAKMIRTGDQGALDRVREAELRQEGWRDLTANIVDSISEAVDSSGLSRKWWLKKLSMSWAGTCS
jgi:hypothetical protein